MAQTTTRRSPYRAVPCRDYIDRLAAAGAGAVMTEHPGALHDFGNVFLPAPFAHDANVTARACQRRKENLRLINVETGEPFTWADACVERGARGQHDDVAARDAQAKVFAPDAPWLLAPALE